MPDLELVLAPHGFDVDPAVVRARLGRPARRRPPGARRARCFGEVLAAAAEAASGDVVLKMDDDDWYGPDVVTDLLWARRTSGAELVGMPAEFVYLEQLGITVRRRTAVERTGRVVAGGTMLIDREHLRALGGFRPVTRYVDAQLIAAVRRAGGRVHRTQGLGYVLRRGAGGHTWAADLGYFLTRRDGGRAVARLPAQRTAVLRRVRAPRTSCQRGGRVVTARSSGSRRGCAATTGARSRSRRSARGRRAGR